MKIIRPLLGCAFLLIATTLLFSQDVDSQKKASCCTYVSPSLPPMGIMGDHHHHKGGWMVSYRYRNMTMDGMQNGTSELGESTVLQNYMMTPTTMNMQGHMLGLMYGVSRRITLMAMMPYMRLNMDMKNRMGMESSMSSAGVGDLKLISIVEIWRKQNTTILGNIGVSLPTGSVDERGDTPMGENMLMPYAMQIGSGSIGILTTLTFSHTVDKLTIGTQFNGNIKLNDNDIGYRFGNTYDFNVWTAYKPTQWISAALRIDATKSEELKGEASELNKMMSPLTNNANSGSTAINGNLGINIYPQVHQLENHVLGAEWGMPIYQKTSGIQMTRVNVFTLGWQYSF